MSTTIVVLLYFILYNGEPVSKTYELPTADWENCQLDLRAVEGMNKVGETLDPPITFAAQCEERKINR